MPRNRPSAVRAAHPAPPKFSRPYSEVDGLSRRTTEILRRLEAGRFQPGYVADAVASYRGLLRQPGRILYVDIDDCPCCDPVHFRDQLDDVIRALPRGGGNDLRRLVAKLDREFERRTLPDIYAEPNGDHRWWRYRQRQRD
ncbi:hypothetical protein [Catenulispora subtropica]|uniref:Uncharacterized protein n=1 Tax=Catenulispora subtropica TaxID=450798 RepID=A0ABN2STU0_9ACTN